MASAQVQGTAVATLAPVVEGGSSLPKMEPQNTAVEVPRTWTPLAVVGATQGDPGKPDEGP